jgi:hypothetical protein
MTEIVDHTVSSGLCRSNCLDELTHRGLQELRGAKSYAQRSQPFRDDLILWECLLAAGLRWRLRSEVEARVSAPNNLVTRVHGSIISSAR